MRTKKEQLELELFEARKSWTHSENQEDAKSWYAEVKRLEEELEKLPKELSFALHSVEQVKAKGLPTYNDCNHYVVDMSHLKSRTDDWQSTIVIKLPFGNVATICVMQTGGDEISIDTAFHGDNIREKLVIPMGEGELPYNREKPNYNRNIYANIVRAKEIK